MRSEILLVLLECWPQPELRRQHSKQRKWGERGTIGELLLHLCLTVLLHAVTCYTHNTCKEQMLLFPLYKSSHWGFNNMDSS